VTETDLIRFVDAQAQVYSQVVEELTDGQRIIWARMPLLSRRISGGGHTANSGFKNGSSFIIAVTAPKHADACLSCLAASSESAAGRLP
jgi:hypothetical protein